ncbi:hypothetical protein KZ854_13520 [Pseudomonas aeruginosa]|nr:hypothetical protein [Pseudomonas aeruginosa]MBG7580826.1 hypothetical protein [Pseudomonas aeruginosa]MBW6386414.1 hypothetical protein [Pseudomonas aeruginosa]MBX5895387.1 hypothetical protein [Pseudomonas aeruginosa]HEK1364478.1 hypothetical protein [Pseudomonas aeruginosa]
MRFSHRYGYDPLRKPGEVIVEDAPEWLRRDFIVSILDPLTFIDLDSRQKNTEERPLGIKTLNQRLCIATRTEMDDQDWDSWTCQASLELTLLRATWWQFYDCVEIIGTQLHQTEKKYESDPFPDVWDEFRFPAYRSKVNALFEQQMVGWRLNDQSQLEMALPKDLADRIEATSKSLTDEFQSARAHYRKAKRYILGTTKDPENSIKESISALESVCRVIHPDTPTLGKALSKMKSEGLYPPMMISVFEKFYAYCNDEPSVRHGSDKPSRVQLLDAELALHLGAAFIRYTLEVRRSKT